MKTWDRVVEGGGEPSELRAVPLVVNDALKLDKARPSVEEVRPTGRLALHIVPSSLLGALWLQFALAIGGEKKYRECATCGMWLELSRAAFRTSRHYCSEGCRSRAYRGRMEAARKLALAGKTAKEIAEKLGSDVKTVRGWLKG